MIYNNESGGTLVFRKTEEGDIMIALSFDEALKNGFYFLREEDKIKDILTGLLKIAILETEYSEPFAKFYSKVHTRQTGGVEIIFKKATEYGSILKPLIFSFSDVSNLMSAAEICFKNHLYKIMKSELYLVDKYYLIVYPIAALEKRFIKSISEFGKFEGYSQIKTAFIEEHGKLLEKEKAIERLSL